MYHLGVATYLSTHRYTGRVYRGVSVRNRSACLYAVFVRDPREDTLAWKGRVQARVHACTWCIWTFWYTYNTEKKVLEK